MIGADFHCHLVQYMHTIVYQIPGLKVEEPKPSAYVCIRRAGIQGLGGSSIPSFT